jgi:hypothetical protein
LPQHRSLRCGARERRGGCGSDVARALPTATKPYRNRLHGEPCDALQAIGTRADTRMPCNYFRYP